MRKYLRRIYIFDFIVLLILSINRICSHKVYSEIEYCDELGKKISWLNLRYYSSVINIQEDSDDSVRISLHNKNIKSDDFLENEYVGIQDIVKVKQAIDEYLEENPKHILNDAKICVLFGGIADDCIQINNYSENKSETDGIWRFSESYYCSIELNKADIFSDFSEIKLKVSDSEELKKLEKWDNLQTVYLSGMDFSQEDKQYLLEILPNCDIYCNDENLS